jgi:polar amino acid transport system substrate-binding protein
MDARKARPGLVAFAAAVALLLAATGCSDENAAGSSNAAAGGEQLGAAPGVLKFGMNPGYPPWDVYLNNSFAGADYDLGTEIAKRLNLKAQWQQIEFGALITSVNSKRIDLILSGMSDTKERQQVIDFVDYYDTPWGFLVPEGNPKGLTSMDDLCGVRASAETGTAGVGFLKTQNAKCKDAGKPEISVTTFDKVPAIQQAIRSGRTDVDLENYDALSYAAEKLGGGTVFDAVALKDLPSSPYGIGIAKNNTRLRDAVVKAFQSMIDDGTYEQILKKNGIAEGGVTKAVVNGATS